MIFGASCMYGPVRHEQDTCCVSFSRLFLFRGPCRSPRWTTRNRRYLWKTFFRSVLRFGEEDLGTSTRHWWFVFCGGPVANISISGEHGRKTTPRSGKSGSVNPMDLPAEVIHAVEQPRPQTRTVFACFFCSWCSPRDPPIDTPRSTWATKWWTSTRGGWSPPRAPTGLATPPWLSHRAPSPECFWNR